MKFDTIDMFLDSLSNHPDKRQALQEFCRQYHYFSKNQIIAFATMSLRYDELDNFSICEISKTIYEEYGSGNPERVHSVLFEKMAHACGIKKEELPIASDEVFEPIKQYVQALHQAFSRGTLAEAFGAYVFLETTAVSMYPRFLTALSAMGFNEEELDFFVEHAYLEPKHLEAAHALVAKQRFSAADLKAYEKQFSFLELCYEKFWLALNETLVLPVLATA